MVQKLHIAACLDDLNHIRSVDKGGMLSFCMDTPKHYKEALRMANKVAINYSKPKAIIVAGMGGSAIGGELLKDWGRDNVKVPIEICREYSLPAYADDKTLAFILSYSGETEETLNAFLEAVKKKCMIICVSSGGALSDFTENMGFPNLRIPAGLPPRAALPYLFAPLLIFMEKLGLVSEVEGEVSDAINVMEQVCLENSPERPLMENFSKKLAADVNGTVPVIYGFSFYRSVAQRFKQQFNENSKVPSKWEVFPELNHNEVVGWERAEMFTKHFSTILIRDKNESEEIRRRIEFTKELALNRTAGVYEVWSRGESKLSKMISALLIGDFTSIYLAILRGIDPTPVETINRIKMKIAEIGTKERILQELRKFL